MSYPYGLNKYDYELSENSDEYENDEFGDSDPYGLEEDGDYDPEIYNQVIYFILNILNTPEINEYII